MNTELWALLNNSKDELWINTFANITKKLSKNLAKKPESISLEMWKNGGRIW